MTLWSARALLPDFARNARALRICSDGSHKSTLFVPRMPIVFLMSYFGENAANLRPVWDESNEAALRAAQVGALWSLGGHFTVTSDPAQAVLPTGVGKTAVMSALPFVVPTTRVLVVTPSRIVRDQVEREFKSLRVLRATGAFPKKTPGPRVKKVLHRVGSTAEWEALSEYDIIVGTPHVISPEHDGVAEIPAGLFDLLIIDEAHHSTARTWNAIISGLEGVRAALFTATPFRRDRQGLPGEIVYEFPLRMAIEQGIYQPIDFVPVTPNQDEDHDAALARVAASRLADDVHVKGKSRLLIRTDRIADAERLVEVYEAHGVKLGVIHSRHGTVTVKKTLSQLESGEIVGIASVGVLGEGFDLPHLKIAVYHRRHKSLPATLQFVGRIARATDGFSAPAELLAVREDVQDETRLLYQDDAAWRELIPALSEAAIETEQQRRAYLAEFPLPDVEDFSPHALQPPKDVQIFEVDAAEIDLDFEPPSLGQDFPIYRGLDKKQELLVVVTERWDRPRWMRTSALDVPTYALHIVVIRRKENLLFVSSPSPAATRDLLAGVGAPNAVRTAPSGINRLLWSLNLQAYSSVGMRSARGRGGNQASYKTVAGSTANRAIMPSESRSFGVGHLIGYYMDAENRTRSLGVSVAKAKVWVPEVVSLLEFKEWCGEIARLVTSSKAVKSQAPLLDLLMPERLEEFPDKPVAAVMHPSLLNQGLMVHLGNEEIELDAIDIKAERLTPSKLRIHFGYDEFTVAVDLSLDGTLVAVGGAVQVKDPLNPHDQLDLATLLSEKFPTVYYADGSSTTGPVLFRPASEFPNVPDEALNTWNWAGVNIRNEQNQEEGDLVNVADFTVNQAIEGLTEPIVIVDHATWELSDVVAYEVVDGVANVHLFHCKASSTDVPGHRMAADLYEVACQVVKSSHWAVTEFFWTEIQRRVEHRSSTHVVHGDEERVLQELRTFSESSPATTFSIHLVQPGLRIEGLQSEHRCNTLLLNIYEWLGQHGVAFTACGS